MQINRNKKNTPLFRKVPWSVYIPEVILAVIILTFTFAVIRFSLLDKAPPQDDSVAHLSVAAKILYAIKGQKPYDALKLVPHPFGAYFVAVLFMGALGVSKNMAVLSLLCFSIATIVTVYVLGNYLGGKWGGVSAATLTASCPFIFTNSTQFFLDMPGASMGLLAFYFLLKSDKFNDKKYSLLFGVALALTLLTKWNGVFLLIAPVAVLLIYRGFSGIRCAFFLVVSTIILGIAPIALYKLGIHTSISAHLDKNVNPSFFLLLSLPGVFLFLLTQYLEKNKEKFFSEKERQPAGALINGVRALSIAQAAIMPMYVFITTSLFSHLRTQTGTFTGNFAGNLQENAMLVLGGFPLLPLFVLMGIIFLFVKQARRFDFFLLVMAFASVFIFTSALAPPKARYLLAPIFLTSVLGGYWVEFTGKFKTPLLIIILLIFIVPYLSFFGGGASFLGDSHLPDRLKVQDLLELRPRNLAQPDVNDYHLDNVMKDILQDYHSRFEGKPDGKLFLDLYVIREFDEAGHKIGAAQLRNDSMDYLADYYLSVNLPYSLLHQSWQNFINKNPGAPVYLFTSYAGNDFPQKFSEEIMNQNGRKTFQLPAYQLAGGRWVCSILILPR